LQGNPMDGALIAQEMKRRKKSLEILQSYMSMIKQQSKQQLIN